MWCKIIDLLNKKQRIDVRIYTRYTKFLAIKFISDKELKLDLLIFDSESLRGYSVCYKFRLTVYYITIKTKWISSHK